VSPSAQRLMDLLRTVWARLGIVAGKLSTEPTPVEAIAAQQIMDGFQGALRQAIFAFAQHADETQEDIDHLVLKFERIDTALAALEKAPDIGRMVDDLWIIEPHLADAVRGIWTIFPMPADNGAPVVHRSYEETTGVGMTFPLEKAQTPAVPSRRDAEKASPPLLPRQRYANAQLDDVKTGKRLDPSSAIHPGKVVRLRLGIGKLSETSHVVNPAPVPDDKLPKDIDLDVMVSSTDFAVGRAANPAEGATVAHGQLFLPADGGAAIAPGGAAHIDFHLRAPKSPGSGRARIGYYYRNILVQSQLLTADIGRQGAFRIATDFTLSEDLTGLQAIPERPRLSILTNANADGSHQFVLRSPHTAPGEQRGETFAVKEAVGNTIKQLRKALAERAPMEKLRRRADLEADIRELAPHGWKLYSQLAGQRAHMFQDVFEHPDAFVIQVLRPTSSSFVCPWAFAYEIPLNSEKPALCPLIADWDGKRPLVAESFRQCPHAPHEENVLCPFGFWGFRYAVEQLSSTDRAVTGIPANEPFRFVVAQTQYDVDPVALAAHVDDLRLALNGALPGSELCEGKDKVTIRSLLGRDVPLVYFYCHGERQNITDPETWLGVGKREKITADEFVGWIVTWLHTDKRKVWDAVRPLVFINACHSIAIYPETLVSYLDAFVTTGRAAGVIGTEVKVHQALAMDVAKQFFSLLFGKQHSVGSALRAIRFDYLAHGNLFGLAYTPYCWSELKVG
jgi:hypothetical protein